MYVMLRQILSPNSNVPKIRDHLNLAKEDFASIEKETQGFAPGQ
jgi:hypothetical protein